MKLLYDDDGGVDEQIYICIGMYLDIYSKKTVTVNVIVQRAFVIAVYMRLAAAVIVYIYVYGYVHIVYGSSQRGK